MTAGPREDDVDQSLWPALTVRQQRTSLVQLDEFGQELTPAFLRRARASHRGDGPVYLTVDVDSSIPRSSPAPARRSPAA